MTLATEARALTESALLDLFSALDSAENPREFLASADAIVTNPENHLPLPVNLGAPDPLQVSGSRAVDIDNAPLVHQYIGEMDRANAADARFWTYLAFATYRAYMEERWSLNILDSWKNRARDRWLLHSGGVTRGKLVRHGIARLWWVAHLTYSPTSLEKDAYIYTREAFKSEDRLNAIFDREVGAFPRVMIGVLDHARHLDAKATDKYLQRIMQYLTLVHGYRDLGVLDTSAVHDLVELAASRSITS